MRGRLAILEILPASKACKACNPWNAGRVGISVGFRGCDGAIAPPFEKIFSIFPSKSERKTSSYYFKCISKCVFGYNRTPLPKS
jgi:hypothetical protein